MAGIKVGQVDIQFTQDWDSVKGNQLVQSLQQVIGAVRTLANQTTAPPTPGVAVHELATQAGLGVDHTVAGLVGGQVLIAQSDTTAHFAFLHIGQLAGFDSGTFEAPVNGDVIAFVNGYWSAVPNTIGGLTNPGADALVMWDTTAHAGAGGMAWAMQGTGIALSAGRVSVDDTQLTHAHLLGLAANDHPQYALLSGTNTWVMPQTFQAALIADAGITLLGNLEQAGQEPEQFIQNTDDITNEGSWRLHVEPGQEMWAGVNDDGSDCENWLYVQRLGDVIDVVGISANSFEVNAPATVFAGTVTAAAFIGPGLSGGGGTGATGPAGPTGAPGPMGTPGMDGDTGADGDPGPPGPSSPGTPGATGPPGTMGMQGNDGEPGDDGQAGPPGVNASALIQQRGANWGNGLSSVVTATNDVPLVIAEDCTIQDLTILTQGGVGSCAIDIWRINFAGFPAVVANSIISGTSYPAITGGVSYRDTVLAGFTQTVLSKGDTLIFHLRSSSTFTQVTVMLSLKRVGDLSAAGYTDARAQNAVAGLLVNSPTIQWTVVANTSISAAVIGAAVYTDNQAKDAVGSILTNSPSITFSYTPHSVLTATVNTNSVLATNGYRKNLDGSITQWGLVANGGAGPTAVLFPIPFPNACLNLTSSCVNVQGTINQTLVNANGFTSTNGAAGSSTYWRAEGF